jgi:inorganic triphosphatase YgiF
MALADTGIEIELKFQVPPARLAAVERALATKTAERVALRARYFDTPDGRLAAAQLALRLRREGDVWVQTLKGRGDGLMQRLEHEVRRPPEAGDPPPLEPGLHAGTSAGAALSAALKGGEAPRLAYGTEIQRLRRVLRHGGARVELALDTGHVIAGDARAPVCELEFELLSGPVSGLLDLASRWADRFHLVADPATKSERAQWLAQGRTLRPVAGAEQPALAPGLPLGAARAAMIGSALRHALPNAAAITAGAHGPDHVHQLRVALRRLRSVLRAFGPTDEARDAVISGLFASLWSTRDLDVLAQTLAPAWAAAQAAGYAAPKTTPSAPSEPVPGPELQGLAMAAPAQPGVTRLWLGLIALSRPLADASPETAEPWDAPALDCLRRWHRQARRLAADWTRLDDESRHRLRKRLKRLRYLLEFSAPLLPARAAARETTALRALQDALGRWNDLVLARAHLAERAERGASASSASPASSVDSVNPAVPPVPAGAAPPVTVAPAPAPAPVADEAVPPAVYFAAGWLSREAQAVEADCARAAKRWRRLKGEALAARRRKRR